MSETKTERDHLFILFGVYGDVQGMTTMVQLPKDGQPGTGLTKHSGNIGLAQVQEGAQQKLPEHLPPICHPPPFKYPLLY